MAATACSFLRVVIGRKVHNEYIWMTRLRRLPPWILRRWQPPVRARRSSPNQGGARQGVSAYPAEVTPQMVANFLHGGAAINVLARHVGAQVVIVDMGVGSAIAPHPDLIDRKIAFGTRDFSIEPAMTRAQAQQALESGIALATDWSRCSIWVCAWARGQARCWHSRSAWLPAKRWTRWRHLARLGFRQAKWRREPIVRYVDRTTTQYTRKGLE